MADRVFKEDLQTPYKNTTLFPLLVQPAGTGTPTITEGDINQTYFTLARTGVGTYTLRTKNPWPNIPIVQAGIAQATPAFNSDCIVSTVVKNTDNTWTISFTAFIGGVVGDFASSATGWLYLWVSFRNTSGVS